MKILFMGTPEFAVPCLRGLVEGGHTLCGVWTQPDRPKNRGMKLQYSPVKEYALTANIPVFQPVKMRDGTALALLKELSPELVVVAAYGRILPKDILDEPPQGCINVHSSLLPAYRGAAPIQWAILNGETHTGVTIQHMAEELDAGDVIAQETLSIGGEETAEELYHRLAEMGASLLVRTVAAIESGTASRTPQDSSKVSFAPLLSRELSPLNWTKCAQELHNQVRGLIPWPMATTELDGIRCKIWRSAVCAEATELPPGCVVQSNKQGLKIACGDGTVLELRELQPDGKRRMSAAAFLAGHPIQSHRE